MTRTELRTPRLLLRAWREEDLEAFAAMNADPVVMEHFPAVLDRAGSDAVVDRFSLHLAGHGFAMWAAEVLESERGPAPFVGFVGLQVPRWEPPFEHTDPCVEVGWRLARDWWGLGLASEGARESLRFAFDDLGLTEVVSFTVPANLPSRRVMEKIGMMFNPADDFDHPLLPERHPLRRHVLYRIYR